MTTQVLTANRLSDGIVVYLTRGDGWTETLSQASLARADEEGARLLEIGAHQVADRQVVEPYLIDVTDEDGQVRPLRFREAIRAGGPTVETLRAAPAIKR